jgi:hypothetical protein
MSCHILEKEIFASSGAAWHHPYSKFEKLINDERNIGPQNTIYLVLKLFNISIVE